MMAADEEASFCATSGRQIRLCLSSITALLWPYVFVLVAVALMSIGTNCVTSGETCGFLSYPTGGVAALFSSLVLGLLSSAEFCGRCGRNTGHQELSQADEDGGLEMEEIDVSAAMSEFQTAMQDLESTSGGGANMSVLEKTTEALKKLDHARPTASDVERLGVVRHNQFASSRDQRIKRVEQQKQRGPGKPKKGLYM